MFDNWMKLPYLKVIELKLVLSIINNRRVKISQGHMAAKLKISQNVHSKIETGSILVIKVNRSFVLKRVKYIEALIISRGAA